MKVEIITIEHIKPSIPTPYEHRYFDLSFFDQCIPPTYFPLILYYSYDQSKNIHQSQMPNLLRKSLSNVFTQFYPLAGRLKGQTAVDCNDEGVYFMEAIFDGQISDIIECPEAKLLDKFIPYNGKKVSVNQLLAIQVSLFKSGGIVIGICISHRIADAISLCTFIKAWAATARGEANKLCPVSYSASLFPSRDSPESSTPNTRNPTVHAVLPSKLVTKRFAFTASAIAALKAQVCNTSRKLQPTRVEAVSALIWKCCMAATSVENCTASAACLPVNLRKRMAPPLPEYSFGNIFEMASAVTSIGETDLASLVGKLRSAVEKIDGDYIRKLQGENGYEIVKNNFHEIGKYFYQEEVEVFTFSSWCRLPIYEADFGWGTPTWVSSASCSSTNCSFLLDSRSEGEVEAWVTLAKKDMAKLEQDLELLTFIKV